MLEKLVIDINVIDEDMNTIEEINVGWPNFIKLGD
jgi:hypothetical protein